MTVERFGRHPWERDVEVRAGEETTVRASLEPTAAALARERAEAVIDVLVRENGVPAERVTAIVADGDQVLADSPRVDFALE